jgi:hypothetical protein
VAAYAATTWQVKRLVSRRKLPKTRNLSTADIRLDYQGGDPRAILARGSGPPPDSIPPPVPLFFRGKPSGAATRQVVREARCARGFSSSRMDKRAMRRCQPQGVGPRHARSPKEGLLCVAPVPASPPLTLTPFHGERMPSGRRAADSSIPPGDRTKG